MGGRARPWLLATIAWCLIPFGSDHEAQSLDPCRELPATSAVREHLLIRLKSPSSNRPFRINIETDEFKVVATGYDEQEISDLNKALADVRTRHPCAELLASCPGLVERLRALDGAGASDRKPALFIRIAVPSRSSLKSLDRTRESLKALKVVDGITDTRGFQAIQLPPHLVGAACDAKASHLETPDVGGLNIASAWGLLDKDDRKVRVCVLDHGYQRDHPDLPPGDRIKYVPPPPMFTALGHGTEVLGIIAALPGTPPIGIAHEAADFLVSSTMSYTTDGRPVELAPSFSYDRGEDAKWFLKALDRALSGAGGLGKGDVLLLERETEESLPVESHKDVAACLREAASLGITVVEPAGNGGKRVDEWVPPMQPGSDSMAIMVGAGQRNGIPRMRHDTSNYGARVNCQAWGECIHTTRANGEIELPPDDPRWYERSFGQTSGASAIVAGVVAVIQAIHYKKRGAFLEPKSIREKLSEPEFGQAQQCGEQGRSCGHIGPQPDLMKILSALDLLSNATKPSPVPEPPPGADSKSR